MCLCIASSDHHGSVCPFLVFHRGLSLANVPQASWLHDFCVWNPDLPLNFSKFSKAAYMEVVQSFGVPLVNCPRFACIQ